MNKEKRARKHFVQSRREQIANVEGDIRRAARARGLILVANVIECGKAKTFHWMFNREEGGRVLDYWPVRGTWWCQRSGERGSIADPFDAVELASKLSSRMG